MRVNFRLWYGVVRGGLKKLRLKGAPTISEFGGEASIKKSLEGGRCEFQVMIGITATPNVLPGP